MKPTELPLSSPEEFPFLLKENIRILLEAYREVHRRMFRFSWRRVFPFSLYFRRIDYLAFSKMLQNISAALAEQQNASRRPPPEADSPPHRAYYSAISRYAELLNRSVELLREVSLRILDRAGWKEVKEGMDEYENSCRNYLAQARELNERYKAIRTTASQELASGDH